MSRPRQSGLLTRDCCCLRTELGAQADNKEEQAARRSTDVKVSAAPSPPGAENIAAKNTSRRQLALRS